MLQISQPEKQTFLVVDDHALVLGGTLGILKQTYPGAEILTAQTAQEALNQVEQADPDLVIVDLVMPETIGETAQANSGLQLLKTLMERYPKLNLVVQSAHVRILVWLKPTIDNHMGGFTVVDKSQPMKELLVMVDWALQERTYTPREIRNGLQLKPAWMQLLQLAFQESLQDTAIAKRMNVSERTVQYYWTKIRDVLEVYPDENKNLRIQTEVRAREAGLID
ncbi:response regulator transcription factor [Leptolyngbya sp. FACHB-36]|uniref:response regulator transcription factor n=1 Tax=Leptolyngbya sp. FACHB-36 TaxID=2692808 RepID=UPI001680A95F|nr:response regulator transcription factor [Leptolyngbya sp. FACHB-36]MBD2019121.1 response regulator transcription factor [Leptolyngbya sp. FACHB-36]